MFRDFRRELVWGALAFVDGSVYVPTAAYCDSASRGGIVRVEVDSRRVTRWTAVPTAPGGGGGPWGWGGVVFDAENDTLLAATSGVLLAAACGGAGGDSPC